jgi:hypothetical protein
MWSLCEPVSSRHLHGSAGRPARTVHFGGYTTGKPPDGLNTAWIIAIIAVDIVVTFVIRVRTRQGWSCAKPGAAKKATEPQLAKTGEDTSLYQVY